MPNYKVIITTEYEYEIVDVNNEWQAVNAVTNDPNCLIPTQHTNMKISVEKIVR
jgi:hypothetical protein